MQPPVLKIETTMGVLLPYDCVRDFLEEHPLIDISDATPRGVYEAIVAILERTREATARDDRIDERRAAPNEVRIEPCALCKGYKRYDSHTGDLICSSCGACSRFTRAEDARLYDKPDEKSGGRPTRDDNIAQWAKKSVEFAEGEYRRILIEKDMDSWNDYRPGGPCHGADAMTRLKRLVHVPERVGPTDRVMAALLLPAVERAFDFEQIADAVRQGKRLPTLAYDPPQPQFACQRCGAAVFNRYEERRHPCGWGTKRRKPVHHR